MTDLAQAIVDMTAAAKGRQINRAELDAATERIAAAIVGPFRSGDSVTIYRTRDGWSADVDVTAAEATVGVERLTWPVANTLVAPGYTAPDPHGANALVINDAVYSEPRITDRGRRLGRHANLHATSDTLYNLHMATGEERLRFCAMAPAIVEAFRRLAETQAAEYANGAETVSKTVVR
jgi:hypothetical protein